MAASPAHPGRQPIAMQSSEARRGLQPGSASGKPFRICRTASSRHRHHGPEQLG
jgi:hypothetical protein